MTPENRPASQDQERPALQNQTPRTLMDYAPEGPVERLTFLHAMTAYADKQRAIGRAEAGELRSAASPTGTSGTPPDLSAELPQTDQVVDDRCHNCWHDKGHHVHWSDDRIGACVLIYNGGQGRCPCEQYAPNPFWAAQPASPTRLMDSPPTAEAGDQPAPTRVDLPETIDAMPTHDHGCRCWPHVSRSDAERTIERVALAEYRSRPALDAASVAPQGQGPAAGKEPWDRPKDPARRFAYWFTSQPYQIQRNFIEHWLGEHPADSLASRDAVAEGHQEAHELDGPTADDEDDALARLLHPDRLNQWEWYGESLGNRQGAGDGWLHIHPDGTRWVHPEKDCPLLARLSKHPEGDLTATESQP